MGSQSKISKGKKSIVVLNENNNTKLTKQNKPFSFYTAPTKEERTAQ